MLNDPIADMLTRIRNASAVSHASVEMPASKLKVEIAKILQKEGYIQSFETHDNPGKPGQLLRVVLKYDANGYPVIRKLQRFSRPGLRRYSKAVKLPRILSGAGTVIVSTSKGLLTDRDARRENIGGEMLCVVQ